MKKGIIIVAVLVLALSAYFWAASQWNTATFAGDNYQPQPTLPISSESDLPAPTEVPDDDCGC